MVTPAVERRVLVYNPNGEAFNSITELAVFHHGWMTARGGDAEESSAFIGLLAETLKRRVQDFRQEVESRTVSLNSG